MTSGLHLERTKDNDMQKIDYLRNKCGYDNFVGEIHFVEADLPERLLYVQAEVVQ